MRKREREDPCRFCDHYHKYEEGEMCRICGHRLTDESEKGSSIQHGAFPSEILPEFLFLGSSDDAYRAQILKYLGISRILNVVPACQNLYKNSFTYHCLQADPNLAFDDAIQFLEQCEKDRARVLVHCMFGKNRSAAIVIAYLMKSKGWNLAQSFQWAKERRPSVELNQDVYQQLQEYEQKIFGSLHNQPSPIMPAFSSPVLSFDFGFPKLSDPTPAPAFNNSTAPSLFSRPAFEVPPQGFTFGAAHNQHNDANQNPNGSSDVAMDGS